MLCEPQVFHSNIPMGSFQNARLSQSQILGHCRTLCVALTEQKLNNIRLGLNEKKFTQDLVLTAKTLTLLLVMSLVTELAALRVLTVILFFILIALSFYILFDALERCRDVTQRLNQEMSDIQLLTNSDTDSEED